MTKKCDKDKEDTLPKYLERRKDGRSSNYYVRLTAPTAIRPLLSKDDYVYRRSTGTADLRRAKVIAADLVAQKLREWHALREAMHSSHPTVLTPLTGQLIQQIAGARLQSWIATDNRERLSDAGLDDDSLAEIESFCMYSDTVMRGILAQGQASKNWDSVVEDILDWCITLGYEIDIRDSQFPLLVRAYALAERNAQKFIAARNQGDEPNIEEIAPRVGTKLSAMTELYIDKRKTNVGHKTISKNISIWRRFIEFRNDVFLDEVTSGDIYRFFEARLHTDDRPWSQGYVDGHAKRALTEMFGLARTLNHMTAPNPVSGLETLPKVSEEVKNQRLKPRYAFSSEKINILFSSEWYRPQSSQFRGKLSSDLGVRYFGPLIGLFHGTRVRESLQLMTNDIIFVNGILCFKFQIEFSNDDKKDKSAGKVRQKDSSEKSDLPARTLKNKSVFRTIPVHPKLIDLGFDKYVELRKKLSNSGVPLFESALPEPGGKTPLWGRAYEQSFLRYVRDKLGFGNGFGSHSFRNQFEDRIRDAQARRGLWPAGLSQLLSGRALPRDADQNFFREVGSERNYGNGYQPTAVLPYLERLNFDDIILPAKFEEWAG